MHCTSADQSRTGGTLPPSTDLAGQRPARSEWDHPQSLPVASASTRRWLPAVKPGPLRQRAANLMPPDQYFRTCGRQRRTSSRQLARAGTELTKGQGSARPSRGLPSERVPKPSISTLRLCRIGLAAASTKALCSAMAASKTSLRRRPATSSSQGALFCFSRCPLSKNSSAMNVPGYCRASTWYASRSRARAS